ncbi:21796_t:CDS:2, partial [Entrophospora sp. SA101]
IQYQAFPSGDFNKSSIRAYVNDSTNKLTSNYMSRENFKKRNAINTMVEKLDDVAFELIRIAPNNHSEQVRDIAEVCTAVVHGSELGIRAQVQGIGGAWKLLIDNVNTMVANLTAQVRDITAALKAATRGDLGKKVTVNVR